MERLWFDLRHAVRQVRRRPIFALVAALSLAIGVGANTAIFDAVSAMLLRPVPGVREPDRVVELGRTTQGHGFDTFAYPDYADIRAQVPALASTAAYTFEVFSLCRDGEGERITGMQVEPAYFDVMGVVPEQGRFFTAEENTPGSRPAVAVLGHRFWTERMGRGPECPRQHRAHQPGAVHRGGDRAGRVQRAHHRVPAGRVRAAAGGHAAEGCSRRLRQPARQLAHGRGEAGARRHRRGGRHAGEGRVHSAPGGLPRDGVPAGGQGRSPRSRPGSRPWRRVGVPRSADGDGRHHPPGDLRERGRDVHRTRHRPARRRSPCASRWGRAGDGLCRSSSRSRW